MVVKDAEAARRLSIFWQQSNQDFEIILNASLGTAVARLVSEQGEHYVELPGEPRRYSQSANELLLELTGLDLPLDVLTNIFQNNVDSARVGPWQVDVTGRDELGRPNRLVAVSEPVTIQLVVTEWR